MDELIQGLLFDKTVAVTAISGLDMVRSARSVHKLSRVCSAALGRTILQCAMMSMRLKSNVDRLTCILAGGGVAGNVVCTAYPNGIVKGYIENPTIELPLAPNGKLDVALAVGWFGDLTVIRDLGMGEPYIGKTAIVSGEIAQDFANYYATSEQQPCLIYLGVRVEPKDGDILSAGGLMITPLPFCPDSDITTLENNADKFTTLSQILLAHPLNECLEEVFEGMDFVVTNHVKPEYKCDCTRERFSSALIALGHDELNDMINSDHGAQMRCDFCNTTYEFSEDELNALLRESN